MQGCLNWQETSGRVLMHLTETVSITGLTYLFPLVLAEQREYLDLGDIHVPHRFGIAVLTRWKTL